MSTMSKIKAKKAPNVKVCQFLAAIGSTVLEQIMFLSGLVSVNSVIVD